MMKQLAGRVFPAFGLPLVLSHLTKFEKKSHFSEWSHYVFRWHVESGKASLQYTIWIVQRPGKKTELATIYHGIRPRLLHTCCLIQCPDPLFLSLFFSAVRERVRGPVPVPERLPRLRAAARVRRLRPAAAAPGARGRWGEEGHRLRHIYMDTSMK